MVAHNIQKNGTPGDMSSHTSALPVSLPAPDFTGQSISSNLTPHSITSPQSGFGRAGGTSITNKDTILEQLDGFLSRKTPPAFEYIFVEPLSTVRLPDGSGSGMNPFGHAVARYTLPDGTQKIMNISGMAGHDMVNFFSPTEYLYGTNFSAGNEQCGVYNRSMIGLRIEQMDPQRIIELNRYYESVQERQRVGKAGFHLSMSRLVNTLNWMLPIALIEMGNCAAWTSSGFKQSGITSWRSYYPKRIFVKLLEETMHNESTDNWNVVSYQRIAHAERAAGTGDEIRGPVSPISPIASRTYRDLHSMNFVTATVHVPYGETTAQIKSGGWKEFPLG